MNHNQIPEKLAVISDIAGFGRCSMTVALPVISALCVQACPVPTSIFSNHTGFPTWYFDDYTDKISAYLHGWEELGLTFDGIYSSFLGSVKQADIVSDFIRRQKELSPDTKIIIDPVMGDHGKAYAVITDDLCKAMKFLVSQADIITPNLTEACLLTDSDYSACQSKNHSFFEKLLQKLAGLGPRKIVVTGIPNDSFLRNLIYADGEISFYDAPIRGESRPGTGDIFASVISACAVKNDPFADSVKLAADFVGTCINASHEAGIPVREGVCFEHFLTDLKLRHQNTE